MSWLRVDDGFTEHEKVEGLSHPAFRLHVAALCLCARLLTDGRVTETQVRRLAVGCRIAPKRYVQELVDARLWAVQDGGWEIKDYLEYNPSSEQVKSQRKQNARRQARWRDTNNAVTNAVTNAVSNAAPSQPLPLLKDLSGRNGDIDAAESAFGKLLRAVGPVDEETMAKLRGYETRLPEGSLAKVAESLSSGRARDRVAYALGALRRELEERGAA